MAGPRPTHLLAPLSGLVLLQYLTAYAGRVTTTIIASLTAIGGALLGSTLAYFLQDRMRKKQLDSEDQRRWLAEKKAVYSTVYSADSEYLRQASMLGWERLVPKIRPLDVDESDHEASHRRMIASMVEELDEMQLDSERLLVQLNLIASSDVVNLARHVNDAVDWVFATMRVVQQKKYMLAATKGAEFARSLLDDLNNAMRSDLGVKQPLSVKVESDLSTWPWTIEQVEEIESELRAEPREPG